MISGKTQICMVIGDPVEHSLSPAIHNAGYRAAGIDDQFVYVASRVNPKNIEALADGLRAMNIRGVSCTMPHKEIIMPFLDNIDDVAAKIGAVNTVVNDDGRLCGYNTDWIGTIAPLKAITSLSGNQAAVIGAGGAAKAMVYGLVKEGANVTVYNRTIQKAKAMADLFGCNFAPLDDRDGIKNSDIICNATPVGMSGTLGQSPIDTSLLSGNQIVLDAIYSPYETALLQAAQQAGARVVHGTDMLLHQALAQFELFTGCNAPIEAMRKALHAK